MGLSAVLPILHGLYVYGYEHLNQSIGLHWLLLEGCLYIFGAALYVVSFSCPRDGVTFLFPLYELFPCP